MATSSFSSTPLFQDLLGKFHSRKLLPLNPHNQRPVSAPPPCPVKSNLDFNVVMFLSVLVGAVICSLGFNFLIRCAFIGCSRLLNSESNSLNLSVNSSGIKKKALKDFPVVNYSTELKLPGLDTECVICLSEFGPGEPLRILSKCNHGFHIRCIDKWLRSHSSCPKCRHCLIENYEKIEAPSGNSVPETVVGMRPLEPEGIVCNYGGLS